LSGGQQQRVALARALAIKPRIVLLDEPFGSLDPALRSSVRSDVRSTLAEAGTTAILVTHDQDEALSLADQLAVLRNGRIVQHGTPREVYGRPVDAELAGFLGAANLLDGVMEPGSRTVDTILGPLPVDPSTPTTTRRVHVLVRPEELIVEARRHDGTEAAAGRDRPTARVDGYDFHGHDLIVRLSVDATSTRPALSLVARVAGALRFERGSEVTLSAASPVMVWPADGDGGELA